VRVLAFLAAKFDGEARGIPLTKTLAFKQSLVADAVDEIEWPEWTANDIYHGFMPIKVASEEHFEPFW